MSVAGIKAVSCVPLTKVVVRLASFHRTIDPFTKFVPVTVRVNAGEPAVAEAGLRPVIVGTGFTGVMQNSLHWRSRRRAPD